MPAGSHWTLRGIHSSLAAPKRSRCQERPSPQGPPGRLLTPGLHRRRRPAVYTSWLEWAQRSCGPWRFHVCPFHTHCLVPSWGSECAGLSWKPSHSRCWPRRSILSPDTTQICCFWAFRFYILQPPVLQAPVSHGESPPSPDWPLPPPNVLPALPCQALATEARGWGGPGPRPGVSSQPIGGPQASSPRGRHGPLSGVPETEADLHPRSLQELARQHHGEHAASVSILARGRSGGDTEAAVPCPLRAPLRLKCLPGFTFRARRPALQGFTGPQEAHSGPTAGRRAGTLTSPTQASPLDHTVCSPKTPGRPEDPAPCPHSLLTHLRTSTIYL